MPARYDLTWDGDHRRWRVQHHGRRHVVSCRQLRKLGYLDPDAPDSKEASYQSANLWWRDRLRGLGDVAPPPPLHPHAETIRRLEEEIAWLKRHEPENAEPLRRHLEMVEADTDDPCQLLDVESPVEWAVWNDRFKREEVAPSEKTVGPNAESYIALIETRHRSGQLSASEFDLVRRSVRAFKDWIGPKTNVATITPQSWERWYTHLVTSDGSVSWKKKQWRHSRELVTHLANLGLLTLPPNIASKKYRFGDEDRTIETFTVDEVKTLLGKATGRLRLVILLCLNCGFTQKDCADLTQREVRWEEGRIVRPRSKTRKQTRNAPLVVAYPLWPRTLELLREYRGDGDLVFTTESGLPWVRRTDKTKTDAVMSVWRHLQVKTGISKPPKLLRKTGATLLKNSGQYGDLDWYYLGDKPRTIPDKHYSGRTQERFDEAIRWLGTQFGL